jgi:hypothetical protein
MLLLRYVVWFGVRSKKHAMFLGGSRHPKTFKNK